MQIQKAIEQVFLQLHKVLEQMGPDDYQLPRPILFNATIGQHMRHIIELFQCLNAGYETGTVNYENRKRDYQIETDKMIAAGLLFTITRHLEKPDKSLELEAGYDADSDNLIRIESNYYRELIYNLEHTVHHMALIRVGLQEVASVKVPEGFGIASSTIKFRAACAR